MLLISLKFAACLSCMICIQQYCSVLGAGVGFFLDCVRTLNAVITIIVIAQQVDASYFVTQSPVDSPYKNFM